MIKFKLIFVLFLGLFSFESINTNVCKNGSLAMPSFILKSKDFDFDSGIYERYTCDGEDISPELEWSGVPGETKSFAIIVDDMDAGEDTPFVHWVIYNIPGDITKLSRGIPNKKALENGIAQGYNDFNGIGYKGPCPPKGSGVHHYHFTIYALDTNLNLEPGATREDLLNRINNHIIKSSTLIGLYERGQDFNVQT